MKAKKALLNVFYVVVVIAGVLGFKFYNKAQASSSVKTQAVELVQTLPDYSSNASYYDQLIEDHHAKAFDQAYRMGGRRTKSKFDQTSYLNELYSLMVGQATSDQRPEIASSLTQQRAQVLNAP